MRKKTVRQLGQAIRLKYARRAAAVFLMIVEEMENEIQPVDLALEADADER